MVQNFSQEYNSHLANQYKVPSFYGPWRFITMLMRAHHWTHLKSGPYKDYIVQGEKLFFLIFCYLFSILKKMFQMQVTDLNEICILHYVSIFYMINHFLKNNTVQFEVNVK
jgi:hypothetical protein